MGFGVMAQPAGAFVIKGNEVSWQPALDLNRVILMGQVVAIVALFTARAIVKAATYFNDPAKLLEASDGLGIGMAGLDVSKIPEGELMQTRGW